MDIYKCLNKGLQFIECVITPHKVNKEMKVQKKKGMKERKKWKDWNKWGQKDGKNDELKDYEEVCCDHYEVMLRI